MQTASAPAPAEVALLAADSFLIVATRQWFPLWVTSWLGLLGKGWQRSDAALGAGVCVTRVKRLTLAVHRRGRKIGEVVVGAKQPLPFWVKVVATAGRSSCGPRRAGMEHLVSVDGFLASPSLESVFRETQR